VRNNFFLKRLEFFSHYTPHVIITWRTLCCFVFILLHQPFSSFIEVPFHETLQFLPNLYNIRTWHNQVIINIFTTLHKAHCLGPYLLFLAGYSKWALLLNKSHMKIRAFDWHLNLQTSIQHHLWISSSSMKQRTISTFGVSTPVRSLDQIKCHPLFRVWHD